MKISILNMSMESNKGDLAILESTLGLLKKQYPQAEISVFNVDFSTKDTHNKGKSRYLKGLPVDNYYASFFPAVFRGGNPISEIFKAGANLLISLWILAVSRLFRSTCFFLLPSSFKERVEKMMTSDFIIIKGGSYISSYGGFKQFIYLYRQLLSPLVAVAFQPRSIALGHSIGPLAGSFSRKITRSCLNRLHSIVLRDDISRQLVCDQLGIDNRKVTLLPDLAFWTPPGDEVNLDYLLSREGISMADFTCPKIGVTVRQWHFPGQAQAPSLFRNYLEAVAATLDQFSLKYGAKSFIMPHSLQDIPVGEKLSKLTRHSHPIVLRGDYSTGSLRKLYGEMDLFIATRIHSALFALTSGTPVVAIAYETPKAVGIVGEVQGTEYILDINTITAEKLFKKVEHVFQNRTSLRQSIVKKVNVIKSELEEKTPRIIR